MARILEASTAAFTKDGFKGTRMRSVATEAGITIQLLVYHVKTKDNLWHLTMEHILKEYSEFQQKTAALTTGTSAAERLRYMIADIVHYTAKHPELHRIMTQEGSQLSPRLVWLIENFTQSPFAEFIALVEQAQKDGDIRAEISPGRLRFAVQAMAAVPFSVSAEYQYLLGKDPFTRSEMAKTIDLIYKMIFVR